MNPIIQNIENNGDETVFEIKNCNVSFVNALRRTIISQIPTVVFRTSPYEKSLVNIYTNTTRLNNEIIKQRLSCIPIHIVDPDIDLDDYVVELNEENNTENIRYITTEHFKIKNIKTDKYLESKQVQRIFPKNSFTNEYILITRLRPSFSDDTRGESLKLTAKFTRSNAEEDSCFNTSSNCTYMMLPDAVKQKEAWNNREKKLRTDGIPEEDILNEKVNWYNHDAKRYFEKDSFKFIIETIGVYTNAELLKKGCDIMREKIYKIIEQIDGRTISIEKSDTLMNAFDIKLEREDYSVGKAIEYAMYSKYYENEKLIDFVSFHKFHPHDNHSIIRLSFKDNSEDKDIVYEYIKQGCIEVMEVFDIIKKAFV